MTSNSHSSGNGACLGAIAGANPTDAESSSAPGHQHQIPLAFQSDALRMISNSPNEVGVEMNTYTREPNGWAAKEAWARHQALIRQLYLYEKKPLKKVMKYIEDQHSFKATIKMYKTHIQEWGLDKKIKDIEMRAVVRKSKQRADQGKSSIILVRGQRRELKEFIRHCDRKGVSIDDIIARHTSSPTPNTVELLTPGPSRISTPQVLEVPERMFRCIRDYFSGSFESRTWVRTGPHLFCYSTKCGQVRAYAEDLVYLCDAAGKMFSKSLFEEGGRTLNAALARIKRIILADQPETLVHIFLLVRFLRLTNADNIALIILRHLSDISKLLLGREHPLTHIFGCYELLYASDVDEIVGRCIEGMTDQFESFVGAMHTSTLAYRIKSIDFAAKEDTRIQKLQRLLGECEGNLQPYDNRVVEVRYSLGIEYYKNGYYVEARTVNQDIFANCQYIPSEKFRKHRDTHALCSLARCQYALGEVDRGIANLNEAINSRISTRGSQDAVARSWLVDLEDWHLEQGNWDHVAQIRDWSMRMLPPIED